jgi:uncharacterized membrane protein YfcA
MRHPYHFRHRSFRLSPAYWLLGLWMIELVFWICAGMIVGCWYVGKAVAPYVLKFIGAAIAFVAFLVVALFVSVANWRRARRTARRRPTFTADRAGTIT